MPNDPLSLKVLIDTEQQRVKNSRIALTVSGEEWGGAIFQDTYLIPKINTLICRPAPCRPEWHTSNTGINKRWSLSDFNLSGPGWTLGGTKDGVGKVRMQNRKGMQNAAVLNRSLEANRAVFVSFFLFNVGNDDSTVYFDCGWTATGDYHFGVALRFWSGGHCDVYKDGVYLATHTIGISSGAQVANQYVDVIILPMRDRELTVISLTGGDSFTHVFEDIPEETVDGEVTPAAPFWWQVPPPASGKVATVDVEIAPVNFVDGFATCVKAALGRAPKPGATFETWENPAPFAGITNGRLIAWAFSEGGSVSSMRIVERDGATPFAPNGVKTECLLRIDMTGGTHTAFVDGASIAYADEIASTVAPTDGPVDLTPFIAEADLTVPDSAEPAEVTLRLRRPGEIGELVSKFDTVSNRPAQVWVNGVMILDGVTMPVSIEDGEHDGVRVATLVIRDRMESLRVAFMRDRMPLDGMDLSKPAGGGGTFNSAVEFWYRRVGIDEAALDLEDANYPLPRIPSRDAKEFCFACEVGAHPFDELRQLQEDLATTWLWGAVPTADGIRYVFKDPTNFPAEPDKVLFRSDDEAENAGADPDEDVYWSYKEEPLEIEANETRAGGWDPRSRRPIFSFREDEDSKNPSLSPDERPDNWLGEERPMGILNQRLARQKDCDRVVEWVHPQVSARYFVGEWDCSMLFREDGAPIWRGHLVMLDQRRSLRVSSLRVKFVREPGDEENDAVTFRQATYTGGTLTYAGGVGLTEIKRRHARRSVAKTVRRQGADRIENATTRTVAVVA